MPPSKRLAIADGPLLELAVCPVIPQKLYHGRVVARPIVQNLVAAAEKQQGKGGMVAGDPRHGGLHFQHWENTRPASCCQKSYA